MARARRLGLQGGRSANLRRQLAAQAGQQPGSSKSQAPFHGQGIGIGLALLTAGSNPGAHTQKGTVGAAPTLKNTVATTMPGVASTTFAITLPTYAAGDLVLINVAGGWSDFAHTGTGSIPGWTQQFHGFPNQIPHFVFYRVMNGTEGATVTLTQSSSAQPGAIATSYTGVKASGTIETSSPSNVTQSGTTWSVGPITTTQAPDMVCTFAMTILGTTITTNTYGTSEYGQSPTSVPSVSTLYLFDHAEPATGSFSNGGACPGNAGASAVMVGIRGSTAA